MLPLFSLIHIQHSTFHQADRCSSLQTVKWFRQSDRKPVRLPFSLKELRTFACFSFASFRILVFHKETFHSPLKIYRQKILSTRAKGLPTYEPWLIPTCESFLGSHRQQTKFAALWSADQARKKEPWQIIVRTPFSALLILR